MKKFAIIVLSAVVLFTIAVCQCVPAYVCNPGLEPTPEVENSRKPTPDITVDISDMILSAAPDGIPEKQIIIPVAPLCQYPELPTGCETVSAVMVLQFYGENVTPQSFAKHWLKCSTDFYTYDGKQYGPDPNKVFAGDPFSKNAYGCFSGVIADAVNRNSIKCTAEIIQSCTVEALCKNYIDNGKPVLIWATSGMRESSLGNTWYVDNHTPFTWISAEHCLVLIGYNEQFYFLNDPTSGSTVAYQKAIVEKRFAELNRQAVCISPV